MKKANVLVTGGAGFIGSHLCKDLASSGYRVRVLDNFSAQVHGSGEASLEALRDPAIEVIRGDVRRIEDLRRALEDVDEVFHFAACVGVGQSMYEVRSYVDTNNLGTATLLQLLIDRPVKRLVVASSMSLYGEGLYQDSSAIMQNEVRRDFERLQKHDWEPQTREGDALTPVPTPESKRPDLASIYALSKFDQERMCLLVGQAYRIPTVALRFFNVYGPGQALSNPYTGVMAIFASRLLNGNSPMIFEDGKQMRDFVHVSDVVQACRLALEVPEASGHAFNVGSGVHYTILEIAQKMAQALGKEHILPEITQKYRVGDIRHCFADIALAQRVLGYRPQVKLSDGLIELTRWLGGQKAEDRAQQAREELRMRGLAV